MRLTNIISGVEVLLISVPKSPIIEVLASGFQLIFGTVIPFLIILGCNIWIITAVRQAAKERLKMTGSIQAGPRDAKHGAKKETDTTYLTRMLILVSIAYLACNIPYRLYFVLLDIPAIGDRYEMEETYWKLRYIVEARALGVFWFLNYAINFYLYCAGGGQKYRNDTKIVLWSLIKCRAVKK